MESLQSKPALRGVWVIINLGKWFAAESHSRKTQGIPWIIMAVTFQQRVVIK